MDNLERIFVAIVLARVIPTVIDILWDAIGQHLYRRARTWIAKRTDAARNAVNRP